MAGFPKEVFAVRKPVSFFSRPFSHLPARTRRWLLTGAGVLLVLLAGFSSFRLLTILSRNAASRQKFDALLAADSASASSFAEQGAAKEDAAQKAERIAQLFEQYPEMAAWISIEGTTLDYPVMQTPDKPNYYLRRDMQGEYDLYGVPYMNEACNLQDSDNLIIYGHSMDNGDMFGSLLKYSSAAYCEEHPVISLRTREGPRQYTVLGAFITDVTPETGDSFAYNDFINAADQAAYEDYIQNVLARAYYRTDTGAVYGAQLLTLSTCEYTLPDGRFVLVAVRTA